MPGGEEYRRWYAMRDRLKKAGKWVHRVPEQEEGEPEPKVPALEPESPETPESLPPLESPETAEGNRWLLEEDFLSLLGLSHLLLF